eukprot:3241742-Rhodomonas_salina.1
MAALRIRAYAVSNVPRICCAKSGSELGCAAARTRKGRKWCSATPRKPGRGRNHINEAAIAVKRVPGDRKLCEPALFPAPLA